MTDRPLTADALLYILRAEWFVDEHGRNAKRSECVEPLLFYWHAGRYVWDQCDQKKPLACLSTFVPYCFLNNAWGEALEVTRA